MRGLSRLSRNGISAGLLAGALTVTGGATALASPVTPPAGAQAGPGAVAGGTPGGRLMAEFAAAARQFQVPESVLLGVLAASGVHQLLSREPSLEELFLAHYGREPSARDEVGHV